MSTLFRCKYAICVPIEYKFKYRWQLGGDVQKYSLRRGSICYLHLIAYPFGIFDNFQAFLFLNKISFWPTTLKWYLKSYNKYMYCTSQLINEMHNTSHCTISIIYMHICIYIFVPVYGWHTMGIGLPTGNNTTDIKCILNKFDELQP